jgi:GNAT superfamily N-acetyltransferase
MFDSQYDNHGQRLTSVSEDKDYAKHPSWTEAILGLSFGDHFPLYLSPEDHVVIAELSQVLEFLSKNFQEGFETARASAAFAGEPFSESKRRYYERVSDCFLFKHGDTTIGSFLGTAIDWSTYYIRNILILPEYQGQGRWQRFLTHLLEILQEAEVDRVEIDVSPANLKHLRALNKLDFNVSGLNLTDRWGGLLKLTKFLKPRRHGIFLEQFCGGPWTQLHGRSNS